MIGVGGKSPSTCVPADAQVVTVGHSIYVDATVSPPPCHLTISDWAITEFVGPLAPGTYDVVVTLYEDSTPVYDPATVCSFEVSEIRNETVVVDLPVLVGPYPWGAENTAQVDLGFSLFEIEAIALHWVGWIRIGLIECSGRDFGLGGGFAASFAGVWAYHDVFGGYPWSHVPFDIADHFDLASDDRLEGFLDGRAELRVSFPHFFHECRLITWPSGQLDSVRLVVAARRMHDFDGDGDADLDDGSDLVDCLGGPARSLGVGCELFDAERDLDVDLIDVGSFQREFTGK
jgi:hypothetical protein